MICGHVPWSCLGLDDRGTVGGVRPERPAAVASLGELVCLSVVVHRVGEVHPVVERPGLVGGEPRVDAERAAVAWAVLVHFGFAAEIADHSPVLSERLINRAGPARAVVWWCVARLRCQ